MFLYKLIKIIFYPFYRIYLWFKYNKNRSVFYERMGHATIDRPKGDIIWVACDNLTQLGGIISELHNAFPQKTILITYKNLDEDVHSISNTICQFTPFDGYFSVRAFIKFWEPVISIRVASELEPVQLNMIAHHNIKNFLINGSLDEYKYKKWKIIKFIFRIKPGNFFNFMWATNNAETIKLANLGGTNIMSQDLIENNRMRTIVHKIKIS